ncbi:Rpn family recombination-promoting nuclease/putative transposase [Dyadobacter fermentans]|uniref:Rpn family recombination-promoting nuclease/putative transposase n=1 Tax=Dyadobacter fermentans TaxID=94254 RepID=UPI001CBB5B53|nr:Rpn family recombination-promoting nuclease/putative transposase [Dyadobacter fermentans]
MLSSKLNGQGPLSGHTMEMHEMPCGRFIDPLSDFGFKRIFGSEANKDVLIDFLNVLFAGERYVADLTFNQNENNGQISILRRAVFDLCCTGADGEQFIIEVQRVRQEYFKDRCLYYSASLIRDQVEAGINNWKYDLKPVYLIGLMDFCFEDSSEDHYLHEVRLVNRSNGQLFYDKFGLTFIEMPRFVKAESELSTELDRWLYLLKNLSKLDKIPAVLEESVYDKVFRIAEVCNLNKEEKMAWDAYLKVKWDNENSMDYAKKEAMREGREEGMKEGMKEGIKEGMKEGVKEGKEVGMKEGMKAGIKETRLQVARNMKTRGFDAETISEITGLTPEEVRNA